MDRKDKKLIKEIIIANIIVGAISIFLCVRYDNYIGILITIISLWTSFIVIRIIMNRHGALTYCYTSNHFKDRLIRKLIKF